MSARRADRWGKVQQAHGAHPFSDECAGTHSDADTLRGLAAEFEWSRGDGGAGQPVPLGHWTDIAGTFLERGYAGLERACQDERMLPYCLGLLEHLKTVACVQLLNRLAVRFVRPELRWRLAEKLNLVCSFEGAPDLSREVEATARSWVHGLLDDATSPVERATAVCALRGVGDADSVARIEGLPLLPAPWAGVERISIRAINKRLARRA